MEVSQNVKNRDHYMKRKATMQRNGEAVMYF